MRRRQALIAADEKRHYEFQAPPNVIQTEERYKCRHCSRDFGSQTGMYIHISRMHTDQWKAMKDRGEV